MKVERNTVAVIHYEMRDPDGTVLESSRDRAPVSALIGHGNMMRGLENALIGREAGEQVLVTLEPSEGYGERIEGRERRMSKKHFRDARRLKPGMGAVVRTEKGMREVSVIKVGASVVDVDMNHPLAGRTLVMDVEIVSVREAEASEKAHGHAHGPGGHQH